MFEMYEDEFSDGEANNAENADNIYLDDEDNAEESKHQK